jgi:predicted RNA-binding protein with PIN domain
LSQDNPPKGGVLTSPVRPAPLPDEPGQVELVGPLPDAVRSRVVALAADALARIPVEQLPASLKRVAGFAPARRARLAGNQIAAALESDPGFREKVATQVRGVQPELAAGLEDGTPPAAAEPVDLAAVAYLLRPEGWVQVVEQAAGLADAEEAVATRRQAEAQLETLRRQVEEAARELRDVRDRYREQVAELKGENTDLRHKLGDARARTRAAEEQAGQARREAEEAASSATTSAAAGEAEARRLRGRVEELERELANSRRAERVERGAETMRARLLLDTLLDTAQGLRRELALPPVEGAPADLVEADVAEHGAEGSSGQRSLAADDPALLDQLLVLPRVHLIVGGYNVTKTAWPELPLQAQRDRLLARLAPLVARSGAEVTVVFDAAEKAERPVVNKPRGVRVLFSPVGVIADDLIRELVAAEPRGRPLVVVTSDQEIVVDVTREGAKAIASRALSRLLARS